MAYAMRNDTRRMFDNLLQNMSRVYGVTDPSRQFEVTVPMEQKINEKARESLAFLKEITYEMVPDTTGEAVDLSIPGMIAGRTKPKNKRNPTELGDMNATPWAVAFTEFDVAIGYKKLDQWARYKDFYQRYMNFVFHSIGLTRLTIGWHGEKAAEESDSVANPLGQDLNIGWLKLLETYNPSNYLTGGKTAGEIIIGKASGSDYPNVDTLAYDVYSAIPIHYRSDDDIVIVGRSLVADDINKVATQNAHTPSEKKLGLTTLANSYAGLPAVTLPSFPDNGLLITNPKNLHLYMQTGSARRKTEDEASYSRVVDYISSNDAYAIGNVEAIAGVNAKNVIIKNE